MNTYYVLSTVQVQSWQRKKQTLCTHKTYIPAGVTDNHINIYVRG